MVINKHFLGENEESPQDNRPTGRNSSPLPKKFEAGR